MPKSYTLPPEYLAKLAKAGRKGGKARMRTQTPEQLSEQGRKAALASVAKRRAKMAAPVTRNAENGPEVQLTQSSNADPGAVRGNAENGKGD